VSVKDPWVGPREQVLNVSITCWYMIPVSWCSFVTTWLNLLSSMPRLSRGRENEVTQDDSQASMSLVAKTSSRCRRPVLTSWGLAKICYTCTTCDVWSETMRGSRVESVWHVVHVFPCRLYIDLNHHDSRIWVSLICGSHHVDNLIKLVEGCLINELCSCFT
jgi:hypothetical protein